MLSVAIALAAALVVTGLLVELLERRRERHDEAAALEKRIADALVGDPALGGLSITASARVPLWRSTPATVVVSGRVPTPALERRAVALVIRETYDSQVRCRIEDHLTVAPALPRAA